MFLLSASVVHISPRLLNATVRIAELTVANYLLFAIDCFFPLCEIVSAPVTLGSLGKSPVTYWNDPRFGIWIPDDAIISLDGSRYVPTSRVRAAADELWAVLPAELYPVMTWFVKNYIGSEIQQGRRRTTIQKDKLLRIYRIQLTALVVEDVPCVAEELLARLGSTRRRQETSSSLREDRKTHDILLPVGERVRVQRHRLLSSSPKSSSLRADSEPQLHSPLC
uniref:Uncharacterized protein n=1 Tax=Ditylenchus dipsaci TaxID=166011 RepID=A0A915EJ18_9BILA